MANYKSTNGQLQNNTVNSAMLITINCVINQVMQYSLTNYFTFHTKFWMLQMIKSDSCGISAIFFQCCFMIETQVLMTVSNFFGFFLGIISRKGASLFKGGSVCFSDGGSSFLRGRGASWGASILMGRFQ